MSLDDIEKKKWLDALNLYQNIAFNEHPEMFKNMQVRGGGLSSSTLPPNVNVNGDAYKFTSDVLIPSLKQVDLDPEKYKDAAAMFIFQNEGKKIDSDGFYIDSNPSAEKEKLIMEMSGRYKGKRIV